MENQEKTKIGFISQPWKVFSYEAFLFSLTLGLGVITASRINKILEVQEITIPQISFWRFILYFLFFTLFILFIVRFIKFKKEKGIIFKALFILAVSLGGLLFLEAWLPEPIPLIIILLLIFWWWKCPSVLNQDLCIILGVAGVGSVLGLQLTPEIVIALLIIFSIYDFIAVYKTKHMVKMAKEMIESGAILALVIPPNIFGFKARLEKIKSGGKFLILGGGDIVFPLLFCASLVPSGILKAFLVAFFALIGLFIGFYYFTNQPPTRTGGGRQPIPALPPIALFSIIGYLITQFF